MKFFSGQISIVTFVFFLVKTRATTGVIDNSKDAFAPYEEVAYHESDFRLPETILPIQYEIILEPQLGGDFSFYGHEGITAVVKEATDTISLHVGNIKILYRSVLVNGAWNPIRDTSYDNTTEIYKIKLQEVLKKGDNILISLEYSGILRDDMIGFYKSSYIDSNGKLRWIAATQFQTIHARHAFPCFDEPSFKAKFLLRILRTKQYTCLSNMPLLNTTEVNNRYWDVFEQSIAMSTYLVAFIISDFDYVESSYFKVWAKSNAINQSQYALSIGPPTVIYLSNLFQQEYQLPKMDMVAVPDFSAGAMENWGLITYRESRLLYDRDMSSDASQQSIASVIVHELTHMWFGNMVTAEWWSYLWLNEAFARYFQYFGTAKIEKSWSMEEQFVVEQHQTALMSDGLETSQPMTRNVSTMSQISGIGDTITYNKGASIVRMMNLVFGSNVFQAGLRNYLKNNKEIGVVRPHNLWKELQNEINSNKIQLVTSVDEIMSTWTVQSGFPVIMVSIENGIATVKQTRFLLRNLKFTPTDITWWVPLTWTNEANPDFNDISVKYWLKKKYDTFKLGTSSGWVIFNVQSAGFYRVTYDNASWYRIINVLNSNKYQDIHVLNRANIVDDLLNLARAGLLLYTTALDGLQYLIRENNYIPFKSALSALAYLDQRFSGHDEYYLHFKKFVRILISDKYKELGYLDRSTDDRLTVLLRSELNKWVCNYDDDECVKTFTKMFRDWRANASLIIKPNQRAVAYCTGIRHGTEDDWKFLWDHYFNSNSATEQVTILQALGCSRDRVILEKYLLYALEPFEKTRIRKQDSTTVFSAVYNSGVFGAEVVLNFTAKYHAQMKKYYNGDSTISSILSSASQRFSTKQLVDQFENLMETHKTPLESILPSLKNSLEIAKYELMWLDKFKDTIIQWIISFNEKYSSRNYEDTEYRLPADIIPTSYSIAVTPYIIESNFTFDGSVIIVAEVKKPSNTITLHSADLIHKNVTVIATRKVVPISNKVYIERYNFLNIELGRALKIGEDISIQISYTGYLNDEMRGFYRSSYVDNNHQTRWLAATHMEPVAARKMFPCFDEPALKARFTIQVTVPENYYAISNMPVQHSSEYQDGWKTITFQETPKMSTYLVALVVSDFVSLGNINNRYAVWARPNAILETEYALSVMEPIVNFYQHNLKLPYQLPKLHMVALPDFASGAMENWGLLTYKERNLLYVEKEMALTVKQTVGNIISHEIAHQWFGNLVSPLWWKYLWLNEGFARYFQYFGTAAVETNWSLESQFVVDQIHLAFEADSLASTHAMTHDVYSPTEIRAIFDSISYAKGASVIRMIEKCFGADVFYPALERYLRKREYDVATPEDLFDAFKAEIADEEVQNIFHDIMNTWTAQPGYPVVHVSVQNTGFHLRQEQFFIQRENDSSVGSRSWYIPITWTVTGVPDYNSTKPKYWLKNMEDIISVAVNGSELYIFNVQQSGFYRVNYEPDYWRRIVNFLMKSQFQEIHEINRAVLIDDLMNLGRAGYVDYKIVLSATQYLTMETNYIPWRAFFNGLSYLHLKLQEEDAFHAYKRYMTALITPIYEKLGFEDKETDSHVTKLLRIRVRDWACKIGVSDCEYNALAYFRANALTGIPPNYRSVSYCMAAKQNDFRTWQTLRSLYLETTHAAEKLLLLKSMACSTDKYFLNSLLTGAITNDSDIRFQESKKVFSTVLKASSTGVESVMDFIINNYDVMAKYYKGTWNINTIVSSIGKRLYTVVLYEKYKKLIDWLGKKEPSLRNTLNSFTNHADYELRWSEQYIPKIHEWLDTNYPDEDYRLPSLFSPSKYNITLSPKFNNNYKFTGNVQIDVIRLVTRTSRIVLNVDELKIKSLKVYESNLNLTVIKELNMNSFVTNKTTQKLSIYLEEFVKSERIMIDIEFMGYLRDDMNGFYRSYYIDDEKRTRWLAVTQFQPTYARSAFPCFDEPAFKANFILNIERPNDYIALGNMPSARQVPSNVPGQTLETFQETVKMSSYLVAFTVCDFKKLRNSYGSVNVWGRPNMAPHGDLAQVSAMQMLTYLSTETGHEYSLPKLDLIGIPDFSMGAMENWGLATFREYGLFYNQNVTTAGFTDYILTIIAHELTHMWYGNLVTCEWWEYIWLNEGFAEYMQWKISDIFRPGHRFSDLFVVQELHDAMQYDASDSSHPMNNPVSKPSEINNAFDTIAYGKSASVIRMIHNSMEPEVFAKAIHQYLDRHQYNTSAPKDLWKAFDDAIKETNGGDWWISMETLMDNWTNKPGYPVVHASLTGQLLTLSQERFFISNDRNVNASEYFYWVPITIAHASKPNFTNTLTDCWLGQTPLYIDMDKPNEWFILNVQQTGYYRVNYDTKTWSNLIDALSNSTIRDLIHVTNRAQIIDDLFNLARANYVHYNFTLNATKYLLEEKEYPPWKAFFNGINFIAQRYEGNKNRDLLGKYIVLLTSKFYETLGFQDSFKDAHFDLLSRELVLTWNCKYNYSTCVNTSLELFAKGCKDLEKVVSPNARSAVYCAVARYGTDYDWQVLWKKYLETEFASEKKIILDALGCSGKKYRLIWYISTALCRDYTCHIRTQDVNAALASVYNAGQLGIDTMIEYLTDEYRKVHSYYGNWEDVAELLSNVASRVSTADQLKKLEDFIISKKGELASISSTLAAIISRAKNNYDWYKSQSPIIDAWLNETVTIMENSGCGNIAHSVGIITVTVFSTIVFMIR